MAAPTALAYVAAQRRLRDQVAASLSRLYAEDIDPDDIAGSYASLAAKAAPVVVAGQSHAATLVQGLVRVQAGLDVARPQDLSAMLTAAQDGMGALGPMVLASIGNGASLPDALAYGDYLLGRYGTSEVIKAADDEQARAADVAGGAIVGWTGIVSPDACDACQANAGDHGLDEEMWRHGNCGCERLPIYGSA